MIKTVALRFSDNFAPKSGTIAEHQKIIDSNGYVWYGKMGSRLSKDTIKEILELEEPKFLLINSGKTDRYWMHISDIKIACAEPQYIPEYYRNQTEKFKCWFKITKIELAQKDVMAHCFVTSSGNSLSEASKHSMSPYFKIEYRD